MASLVEGWCLAMDPMEAEVATEERWYLLDRQPLEAAVASEERWYLPDRQPLGAEERWCLRYQPLEVEERWCLTEQKPMEAEEQLCPTEQLQPQQDPDRRLALFYKEHISSKSQSPICRR